MKAVLWKEWVFRWIEGRRVRPEVITQADTALFRIARQRGTLMVPVPAEIP